MLEAVSRSGTELRCGRLTTVSAQSRWSTITSIRGGEGNGVRTTTRLASVCGWMLGGGGESRDRDGWSKALGQSFAVDQLDLTLFETLDPAAAHKAQRLA